MIKKIIFLLSIISLAPIHGMSNCTIDDCREYINEDTCKDITQTVIYSITDCIRTCFSSEDRYCKRCGYAVLTGDANDCVTQCVEDEGFIASASSILAPNLILAVATPLLLSVANEAIECGQEFVVKKATEQKPKKVLTPTKKRAGARRNAPKKNTRAFSKNIFQKLFGL